MSVSWPEGRVASVSNIISVPDSAHFAPSAVIALLITHLLETGLGRRQGGDMQWTGSRQRLVASALAADTRDIQVRRSGGDVGSADTAPD